MRKLPPHNPPPWLAGGLHTAQALVLVLLLLLLLLGGLCLCLYRRKEASDRKELFQPFEGVEFEQLAGK